MFEHVKNNAVAYAVTSVMGLFGFLLYFGFMAYMDLRHIKRVDWINEQITEVEDEIERLELYNEFGSEGNRPARVQIIKQYENKKQRLEREKDSLER